MRRKKGEKGREENFDFVRVFLWDFLRFMCLGKKNLVKLRLSFWINEECL